MSFLSLLSDHEEITFIMTWGHDLTFAEIWVVFSHYRVTQLHLKYCKIDSFFLIIRELIKENFENATEGQEEKQQ